MRQPIEMTPEIEQLARAATDGAAQIAEGERVVAEGRRDRDAAIARLRAVRVPRRLTRREVAELVGVSDGTVKAIRPSV